MAHDVFISYSRADVKIADGICKAFDDSGISYWIDRGGITSGEAFHAVIVKAIRDSKITVFISSVNSNMSEYTIKEIVIAFKSKKHIIPFCIDEEPFADKLEFYLCDLDQLAYYMEKEFTVQKLVGDILRLLNKIPEKSESVPVTPLNLQRPTENKSQCFFKIRSNLSSWIWIDGDFVSKAEANQILKLPLNKGKYWIEVVSCENGHNKYAGECIVTDQDELISIDLESISQKREKEEAEISEKEKRNILKAKEDIVSQLEDLIKASNIDFNTIYSKFKKLQKQWDDLQNLSGGSDFALYTKYKKFSEDFWNILSQKSNI